MSWEIDSCETHLCPCGDGEFQVVSRSNDWFQTEENWEMLCPKCKENYECWSTMFCRPGKSEKSGIKYSWVEKEKIRERKEIIAKAEEKKEKASFLMKGRYLSQWHNFFQCKSKKAIWEILTDGGARYPRLSTFYAHVKTEGIKEYLGKYFLRESSVALTILGINDREVYLLLSEAKELEGTAESILPTRISFA